MNQIRRPKFAEANVGAIIGAMTGATGCLFAPGLPLAIAERSAVHLFAYPLIGVICFLIGALTGWLVGGQLGPRCRRGARARNGEFVGGVLAGLLPIAAVIWWGWSMTLRGP